MKPIYQTSAQLKAHARRQLQGNYGIAIAMQVLVQITGFLVSGIVLAIVPSNTIATYMIAQIISYILSAVLGVTQAGIALYCLNIICNRPHGLADLLYGFKNQFEKTLVLSLIVTLPSFLYMLILELPLYFLNLADLRSLIWVYGIMLVGMIAYLYFSILLSQVFFVLLDFPSRSAGEILSSAIHIIRGHKRRLLYIELSFIPLVLLSLFTCGIGLLWIVPYQNMTHANFYLDLMNPQSETGTTQ